MPAPVPIQIRYDDAGLLGLAAAQAGSGQAWNQQHAMDMQLIMQQMQNRQQSSMLQQQQDFQLQQQQDRQSTPTQAPPEQNFFKMSDLSDPSTAMKNMGLQEATAAGVGGPELAMLQTAAGNKNINAAYFENIKDETIKRAKTQSEKDQNAKEKNAYLGSLGNSVPAAQMPYLKSLADAGEINLPQFTTKVHEMQQGQDAQAKEAQMMQKAIAVQSIQAADDKINFAQSELTRMEADLQKNHPAVANGPTTAGVGTYDVQRTPWMKASEVMLGALPGGAAVNDLQGQLRSVTPVGQPGDVMGLQARVAIARKKREIELMQNERQKVIDAMGIVPTAAPVNVKQMSNDELLKALGS